MKLPTVFFTILTAAVLSAAYHARPSTNSIEYLQLQPDRQPHITNILRFPVGRTVVRIETPALSRTTGLLYTNTEIWQYDGRAREWVEVWQTNDISQLFLSTTNSLTNFYLPHVLTNYVPIGTNIITTNWYIPHAQGMRVWTWKEVLGSAYTNWYAVNGGWRPLGVNPYTNTTQRQEWNRTNGLVKTERILTCRTNALGALVWSWTNAPVNPSAPPFDSAVGQWMWSRTNSWPATAAPFGSSASDLLELQSLIEFLRVEVGL
jgi:hypothetical protein